MSKKINEENLVMVNKAVKKLPANPKKLSEIGLTKDKLISLLIGLPGDTPIITKGFDHTYDHLSIQMSTALFDSKKEIINEDFGEDMTPESKYGERKQVVVIM